MYLKHLELHGFKTFADRTELEFGPGITAIVGPNGSGKSNVFDAIRWALGEMGYKSLRSSKMDDVIFGGSSARRAMGLAEVSLTIDNDSQALPVEYSEVTVTRRANRGGEGEYVLNQIPCRLRDIQMLFLGTGLGGRSYSLIGQGQVDSVLNAGPADRRLLLEEAAGLARYKRRRREAERRLGHAQSHLLRVADVLAELTAQMDALREQADAATQYQAYTREARDLDLAVQVDDARRILSTLKRISTQQELVRQQLTALAAEAAEVGAQIDHDRARAGDVAREWEETQRLMLQIVEDLAGRESALQVLAERIRSTLAQRDRLADDLQHLVVQRDEMEQQRGVLAAQVQTLEARRLTLRDGLRLAEAAQGAAVREQDEGDERLAALRAEIADIAAARTRITHELARMEERLRATEDQFTALEAKRSTLAAEETRVTAAATELQAALADLHRRHDEAVARVDDLTAQHRDQEQRDRALEDQIRQLSADRQVVSQTRAFLEEMHSRLAGYEQGVREILLAKQAHPERFQGIRYPVLDLLRVASPYRAAIEAALGRTLFSLVATSVEDVKGGLTYLRGNGQGNASFIPIDLLTTRSSVDVPAEAQIVARATDLVELTNGAREVVDALLGDVIVVASLDDAVGLRNRGFSGRIATLDGELLSPDGVISFRGKMDGEALLLGRADQIASLHAQQTQLDAAMIEAQARRQALKTEVATLVGQIRAAQDDAAATAETLTAQQAALSPLLAASTRFPEERADLDRLTVQLTDERERLTAELTRLRVDESELSEAIAERERSAVTLETAQREAAERTQAISSELADTRVQLAEVESTLEAARQRVDEGTRENQGLTARCDQLQEEMTALDAEHHRLTSSLDEVQRARNELLARQEATRGRVGELEAERAGLQQRLMDLEATWRQKQEALRDLEDQSHRLEVRHAQVETEFAGSTARISAEFAVGWDDVREVRLPSGRDEAVGRIEALRGLIAALGPVNLRAVDEHAALAARVAALRSQADDLERARAALGALIQNLDEVLRVRFAQTFRAVNEEFNRLFVRLFGGGRAQLLLLEPDPADTAEPAVEVEPGIEIEAQLPGKKMRSLSALSGGERVLTALALIFAMLRVHPSPFCIFDEVEAALDDANTRRFTTLLRELAERTQVLIITHNKGTMEAADVLYGVTMEQPGVSKIISMRLTRTGTPVPAGAA